MFEIILVLLLQGHIYERSVPRLLDPTYLGYTTNVYTSLNSYHTDETIMLRGDWIETFFTAATLDVESEAFIGSD